MANVKKYLSLKIPTSIYEYLITRKIIIGMFFALHLLNI